MSESGPRKRCRGWPGPLAFIRVEARVLDHQCSLREFVVRWHTLSS
jgi:hypothetical protein